MEITLNGQIFEVAPETRLTEFLAQRGFRPERVLLEINGTIIPSGEGRQEISLNAGDKLVALKLVAGG